MRASSLFVLLLVVPIFGDTASRGCNPASESAAPLPAPGVVEIDESTGAIVITGEVTVGPDRVALKSHMESWVAARVSTEEISSRIKAYKAAGKLNGTLVVRPAGAQRTHKFPVPVDIDPTKGATNGNPNRVRVKADGTWYAFVPGGKYKIGSNKLKDSREIEVELDGYYISETRITYEQIGNALEAQLASEIREMVKDDKDKWAGLGKNDREDVATLFGLMSLSLSWSDVLHGDNVLPALDEVSKANKGRDTFVFTPEARAKTWLALQDFRRDVGEVKLKGARPYNLATFSSAVEYAQWCGVALPTEAQWEAAARLNASKRLSIASFPSGELEWCSDYYAYDYFFRKTEMRNPLGPASGKFSKEQLLRETPSSSLVVMTRLEARMAGVLRGKDVSTRSYGLRSARATGGRYIRTVLSPSKEEKAAQGTNGSPRESLQGTWKAVSGQEAGKPLSKTELADRLEAAPITCDGNKLKLSCSISYTFENPKLSKQPKWERADFNLESTKTPKELNFHDVSKDGSPVAARCIYSLENNTLTICWGNEKERPKEFKTAEGDGFVLVVYKRVEPPTKREKGT